MLILARAWHTERAHSHESNPPSPTSCDQKHNFDGKQMHSSGRMSFSWVLYHILSPLAFYVGLVFFIMILYRSGDSTGLRKWSSSALMNQSCSSTSCDPQCSSTQHWKALNPLKWQCLITKWGNLLKDQQTHWTKMSVQEGAIKPASGQPCSCQANLCEGVHPLWNMCTTCGFAPKCLKVAAKHQVKKGVKQTQLIMSL